MNKHRKRTLKYSASNFEHFPQLIILIGFARKKKSPHGRTRGKMQLNNNNLIIGAGQV